MAFAAVLDDKLRNSEARSSAGAGPARHVPTVQAFVFEFAAAFGTAGNFRTARFDAAPAPAGVKPAEFGRRVHAGAPPPRTRPTLSPRAQSALDRLNALGACIAADFTPEELRRAFRTLAHRYHPDRHPGSGATEKARLSRQFIQVHDAYRELRLADPLAA